MGSRSSDRPGTRGWGLDAGGWGLALFGHAARQGCLATEGRLKGPRGASALACWAGIGAVCAAFAFLTPALAQQSDRARAEALARRATERLQSLQREADRLAAEERSLLNDVKKLEIERQIRAEELRRVDAD